MKGLLILLSIVVIVMLVAMIAMYFRLSNVEYESKMNDVKLERHITYVHEMNNRVKDMHNKIAAIEENAKKLTSDLESLKQTLAKAAEKPKAAKEKAKK